MAHRGALIPLLVLLVAKASLATINPMACTADSKPFQILRQGGTYYVKEVHIHFHEIRLAE